MKDHKQFTFLVAKGNSYTDDYGCFCSFCDVQIGWSGNLEETEHKKDCAMLQARQLLGKEWTNHLANIKKKKDLASILKQVCEICNREISHGENSLRQHQVSSENCRAKAKEKANAKAWAKNRCPTDNCTDPDCSMWHSLID